MQFLYRRTLNPTQIVILSFALVILVGTILLSLPFATASGERMPLFDAFFTAVSATCVTGLIVVDTGTHFSIFGQIVILICIQIGGLGLMAFTTIFVVALGSRVAIADRLAILQSFHHSPTSNIKSLVKYIVLVTLIVESIGAAILFVHWSIQGRFSTYGETLYHAVFHAVSAFCNAGFSLNADSFIAYNNDGFTILTISVLIVVGGIGFLVALDVKEFLHGLVRKRAVETRIHESVEQIVRQPRLSVHTKFVLITTVALIVIGTLSYYVLERNGLFGEMSVGTAWLNAFFCSITSRTAGFNTIDYGGMSGAALLCTMVLMFIGASPGSAGGGVKTSTFGVLVAYSISRWFGHRNLNIFGRTVPQISIDRAAGVVISAVALLIIVSSVLMAIETYYMTSKESQESFLSIAFETVSAFGTVGLSMGQTETIGTSSKIVISIVMFLGRVGPLTLALAISRKEADKQFRYPEENIMVG
jgi:trk system potassium uptake protein